MPLTRPWLPLALALALTGCGAVQAPFAPERGASASTASASAPLAELRQAIAPLATVDPLAGRQDLAPIKRAIGEARIVGLGEATHGTREFFRMKHRLFAYMVEEMGFTVFAIEGHRYAAEALNRYIQTGEGDPRAILGSEITQTWHMEELLDLVAWMRAYNEKRGDRPALAYAGFDLQAPQAEIEAVLAAIARLDPARGEAAAKAYDMPAMIAATPAERASRLKQVRAIEAWVEKRVPDPRIRYFASVVSRTAEMFSHVPTPAAEGSIPRYVGARDAGMAANVEWLASSEYPGRKIALWAHNSHVGDFKDYAGMKGADMMGRALKARFGKQYYRL
ncbi:MAG: erythromycin esterase family protein, partial [Candidatus Sericytochromatia bacterium]